MPRRYVAPADDRAELVAIAEALQNVPRDSTASMPDMLFHNRRMAGRIRAVVGRIEPVDDIKAHVLQRSCQAPPPAKAVKAERMRTITAGKGRPVRVVERRTTEQLALSL